jgi:hypothetical protein
MFLIVCGFFCSKKEDRVMSLGEFVRERRRHSRVAIELCADNLDMDTGRGSHCTTHDVSKHGVGLVLPQEMAAGADLVICLSGFEESRDIVRTRARVVWTKKYGLNKFRSGVELHRDDIPGLPH